MLFLLDEKVATVSVLLTEQWSDWINCDSFYAAMSLINRMCLWWPSKSLMTPNKTFKWRTVLPVLSGISNTRCCHPSLSVSFPTSIVGGCVFTLRSSSYCLSHGGERQSSPDSRDLVLLLPFEFPHYLLLWLLFIYYRHWFITIGMTSIPRWTPMTLVKFKVEPLLE